MKILILDDDSNRHLCFKTSLENHELTHVYTVEECVKSLETEQFDVAFLDHDLSGKVYQTPGPDTGYAVAEWMRDNPERRPPKVIVHSLNAEARCLMVKTIPGAIECPGAWYREQRMHSGKDCIYS